MTGYLRWTAMACSLFALLAAGDAALSQSRPAAPPRRGLDMLLRLSLEAERVGLAEPFKGITTGGTVEPELFTLQPTGVSTAAVRRAAEAFLASLTARQRERTLFNVDDAEWRKWMNQSFYVRQGVSFLEMSETQQQAALDLMRAALSVRGLELSRDIMRLNTTLAELTDGNFDEYGEGRYHVTVMGRPSPVEPWGFQVDGHHLVINYFVIRDQVVMSPTFTGSEPVIATEGAWRGTAILQVEQDRALAFVNGLDDAQRARAVLKVSKTGDGNLTEAWRDNVVLDYAGLPASAMSDAQRRDLLALVELYVGMMDDGHARVRMEEVRAHLDRTWFAWIGGTGPEAVFYYRIHSPVVLVEFDHQRPVAMRHLLDPALPTRQHIHTVLRTPNGNDYGKDLLRQHYAQRHTE
jgi:Protein of unknown function (DUF3500)